MIRVVAAWCIGMVLLAAFSCMLGSACASAQLAPATEVSNLDSTERACVSWADARAAADECIATTYAAFCKRYPDSCPQDGGAE